MKKIDTTKSVWYKRYCPNLIEDLILPNEMKTQLQEYVNTQDIPNLGLFSNLPGCLLPGTSIQVEAEPKLVTGKEFNKLFPELNFTNRELGRIRYYTGVNKIDLNLVTPIIIEIAKLKGDLAISLGRCMSFEKNYKDKHLKVMYWVNKYSDIQKGIDEVRRIRKFREYFDTELGDFSNCNQENLTDILNKIKFKILYSDATIISKAIKEFNNEV